jgi:hypothetical protein
MTVFGANICEHGQAGFPWLRPSHAVYGAKHMTEPAS